MKNIDPKATLAAEELLYAEFDKQTTPKMTNEFRYLAYKWFRAGVEWRDQNPSREMVERIVELARCGWIWQSKIGIEDYGHPRFTGLTVDEIMVELDKVK